MNDEAKETRKGNGSSASVIRLIVEIATLLVIFGSIVAGYSRLETLNAQNQEQIRELKQGTVQRDAFEQFAADTKDRLARIENLLDSKRENH